MRKCYQEQNFRGERVRVIEQANAILDEYARAGLRVTLRQLYYQFVSRDLLANTDQNYKRLGETISAGRIGGLIDWDAIEDRGRVPDLPSEWSSIDQIVDLAMRGFRLPRWRGQACYVEVWCEKQALAGVLEPITKEAHVTMMVNKGYSSQSAMREAAQRFIRNCADGQQPVLLYLGDHDPSGEDMVRDVADRLHLFGVRFLEVTKVALTMEQIEQYNPPPNPAKSTDSRYEKYAAQHGTESWELDALSPPVLQQLVTDHINAQRDRAKLDEVLVEERRQRDEMRAAIHAVRGTIRRKNGEKK